MRTLMPIVEEPDSGAENDAQESESQSSLEGFKNKKDSLSLKSNPADSSNAGIRPEDVVAELRQDLQTERMKNQDISKRLLYLQADFANLQRQSERRIAEARDETKLRFIEELVSLKEDLERAMSVAKVSNSATLYDGLRMLLSRIEGSLRAEQVERINASTGLTFDPRLHEAVAYSEGETEKDGTILSVVSNGYTLRGKVIKPALVEVARQNLGVVQQVQVPNEHSDTPPVENKGNKEFKEPTEEPLESTINPQEKKTGGN